jgi:lipoic acid synthetase
MRRKIDANKPKIKIPFGRNYIQTKEIVHKHQLHTICESGHCPNLAECWGNKTATLMILGNICTRSCKYCSVPTGKPLPPDPEEAEKIAESINLMQLKHCVLTSVDRDDLLDLGATFWANVITTVRKKNPHTTLETLIPDFDGKEHLLDIIINVKPEIVSHNLETVERLTPNIRSRAKYKTSLKTLKYLAQNGITTKTGIMLGLGETQKEVLSLMDDVLAVNCRIITIGQYLQASTENIAVQKFISEEEFEFYKIQGLKRGFKFVESGSLIRSSYHAEKHI